MLEHIKIRIMIFAKHVCPYLKRAWQIGCVAAGWSKTNQKTTPLIIAKEEELRHRLMVLKIRTQTAVPTAILVYFFGMLLSQMVGCSNKNEVPSNVAPPEIRVEVVEHTEQDAPLKDDNEDIIIAKNDARESPTIVDGSKKIKDYLESREQNYDAWKRAAEVNNPEGQVLLGLCHYYGSILPLDTTKGVQWFSKAAELGLDIAQHWLGVAYAEGKGVRQNTIVAIQWYRKAAEQGLAIAQSKMGVAYAEGKGDVPKDEAEAVLWFRKAAEQGLAEPQAILGGCYAKGTGVPKDEVEAVGWFRKAAEQGLAESQVMLGACYAKGTGVPKDEVEAVGWFRKAAEQGLVQGHLMLGICYVRGIGVRQDFREGLKWLRKAADQGDETAISMVENMEKAFMLLQNKRR